MHFFFFFKDYLYFFLDAYNSTIHNFIWCFDILNCALIEESIIIKDH